ncbi:MAG TPA: translation initiation factor eIF-1A [Acidobacteriota bacterium]|nr:translation initiation factor eIF-1A [Acidobacteriota bacterium]
MPPTDAPLESEEMEITRLRTPRGREVIGVLDQRVGGSRMKVRCMDGKVRLCRIPGKLKRKLWTREGDILLIEPWEFGGDDKGDVVFKYKPNQVQLLKARGLFQSMDSFEEF